MKFSDGFWLNQRGFDVNYAVSAYEITTTANSITVFATSSAIYNRAMTLGGVTFEITYTSTAPDVIKVSVVHHKGTLKNAPKYELNEDLGYTPEITTGEDFAEMVSGNTKVRIK
ncbi:MAG: alpha-xylosidase, partial [Porcipelethomonas sp.]